MDCYEEDSAPLLLDESGQSQISLPAMANLFCQSVPDNYRRQMKQESSGPTIRKIPLARVDNNEQQPAFLRWVSGRHKSWKFYDAHMPGFQSKYDMRIRFQQNSLGISYQGNTVMKVYPGSQSEKTGVRKFWTIIAVNGEKMPNNSSVIQEAICKTSTKDKITEILFSTRMPEIRKCTFQTGSIGINYKGNCITDVTASSQAAEMGVAKGWIIMSVNNRAMPDNSTVIEAAIHQGSQGRMIIQISFQIPNENIIEILSRDGKSGSKSGSEPPPKRDSKPISTVDKPDKTLRMGIREKRTGIYPRLYSNRHDQNDPLLKTIEKVKSRFMNKYVIK